MTCNHINLSSPVTVSLCLDVGDFECCPDEFETMVVCKDCGYYKITSVQEVCADCCNKDVTIWDDYLNTWHAPDGSEGWSGTNLGFNLINYSVYQDALNNNAISSCEFMVKGYHYTKPTNPVNVNSCRLYFDNQIETSSINNDIWIAPSTGILEGINQKFITEEIPSTNLLNWSITLPSSIVPASYIYISLNSIDNIIVTSLEYNDAYNTISHANTDFTTTVSYNAALRQIDISQDGIISTSTKFYVQYYINTNYKLHLKGFHNFFVRS